MSLQDLPEVLRDVRHQKALARQKRYRESHKEELKAKSAEYRAIPEVKEHIKKVARVYNQEQKEKKRKYRQVHKDRLRAKQYAWIRDNPKRIWAHRTIASHRRKGYIVSITPLELLEYAKGIKQCPYCGKTLNWTPFKGNADPLSPSVDRRDNQNHLTLENINIICVSCNRTKNDRSHVEFVEYCKRIVELYGEVR